MPYHHFVVALATKGEKVGLIQSSHPDCTPGMYMLGFFVRKSGGYVIVCNCNCSTEIAADFVFLE